MALGFWNISRRVFTDHKRQAKVCSLVVTLWRNFLFVDVCPGLFSIFHEERKSKLSEVNVKFDSQSPTKLTKLIRWCTNSVHTGSTYSRSNRTRKTGWVRLRSYKCERSVNHSSTTRCCDGDPIHHHNRVTLSTVPTPSNWKSQDSGV